MRYLFVLFLVSPLFAQAQVTSDELQVKDFGIETDVYNEELYTTGMVFHFQYYYTNPDARIITSTPILRLKKDGIMVYEHRPILLPLRTNTWNNVNIFIPYRAINLTKGKQDNIELEFVLPNLLEHKLLFDFEQATRYAITINLKGGAAKKKLKQYDKGTNPQEWRPDTYFTFKTAADVRPLYTSKVNYNDYNLKPEVISLYVLEGEALQWDFYDKDGNEDQHLGTYKKLDAKGDFKDQVFGAMFDDITNLEFEYIQKELAYQSISIYSDGTEVHNGIEGVKILVEYDLSSAYIGEKALAQFNFYNEQGTLLEGNSYIPLDDETPAANTYQKLKRKGVLRYFIPFYTWESSSREIEFQFKTEKGEILESAKHLIRRPIEFGNFVYHSNLAIEEGHKYKGARGVCIALEYQVKDVHKLAAFGIQIKALEGSKLPKMAYLMRERDNSVRRIRQFPFKLEDPAAAEKLKIFIPYLYINDSKFRVQLFADVDVPLAIIDELTPTLQKSASGSDADFQLVKAGNGFLLDNYGQVLHMKTTIPPFFQNKSKLHLHCKLNGKIFKDYIYTDNLKNNKNKKYIINQDSLVLALGIPHRLLKTNDKVDVEAYITDLDGNMMSKKIIWNYVAPNELWNRNIQIAINKLKFDKQVKKDTTKGREFPWRYSILIGGKPQVDTLLPIKFKGKYKLAYTKDIFVNREDNIEIFVYNARNNRKIKIWKGDLSKLAMNDNKAEITDQAPIKSFKISADVFMP